MGVCKQGTISLPVLRQILKENFSEAYQGKDDIMLVVIPFTNSMWPSEELPANALTIADLDRVYLRPLSERGGEEK